MPLLERMEYKMELEVDFDSTDHDRNVGDIVAVEVENQALWRAKVNNIDFLNTSIFNVFSVFSQFRTSKVLQGG